ncbi:MAG: cephalosporin hydroxylase, partial [Paracoccaceae bacterium]
MSQIDPLSRLAVLNGTDKFGYHDYTPNYHRLLHHLRDKPIRLLEIGVGGYGDEDRGGESLAVWRDYFPNAKIIVGIDIQRKTMDLGPRVEILQGSQVDPEFLEQVQKDHGPFDVIIDDGSHRTEHVIES